MFVNLVRIHLMRLCKSRATIPCTAIACLSAVLVVLLYGVVASEMILQKIIVDIPNDDMSTFWSSFFMAQGFSNMVFIYPIVPLFFVCDYYKYRQMINIEGVCHSTFKLCASEVVALFMSSFVPALVPIILGFIGGIIDVNKLEMFLVYPNIVFFTYIATAYLLFSVSLVVYAFGKVFRKKAATIVATILLVPCYGIVMNIISSFFAREGIDIGNYIFPALSIFDVATGKLSSLILPSVVLISLAQNLFWFLVALIASRRRDVL